MENSFRFIKRCVTILTKKNAKNEKMPLWWMYSATNSTQRKSSSKIAACIRLTPKVQVNKAQARLQ